MKKILSIGMMMLLPLGATQAAQDSESKSILFIAGAQSHGTGEHEHRAGCILLMKALDESGLDVTTKLHAFSKEKGKNTWPQDQDLFAGVDTAVIYADAAGRMDAKTLEDVQRNISRGMGLMFIHYGVHPSPQVGEKYFLEWIGGYFNNDVSVNPHWFASLHPNANHPVKNGITSVEAHDEWYYNMAMNPEHQVLASALVVPERITKYNNIWHVPGDEQFGKQVALMWANKPKDENASRGVGFTGGHYHHNWAIDSFRKLVLNAIVWTAKIPVPENGVSSKQLTAADLNKNLDGFAADEVVKKIMLPSVTLENLKADTRPTDPLNYMENQRKARAEAKRKRDLELKKK